MVECGSAFKRPSFGFTDRLQGLGGDLLIFRRRLPATSMGVLDDATLCRSAVEDFCRQGTEFRQQGNAKLKSASCYPQPSSN